MQALGNVKGRRYGSRNIPKFPRRNGSFLARLSGAPFRSGDWLTAARARGYSLILLVICTLAFAGWIAVSDGLIDRNGKPLGTDFSNVYAAGTLTWQGRPARGL